MLTLQLILMLMLTKHLTIVGTKIRVSFYVYFFSRLYSTLRML